MGYWRHYVGGIDRLAWEALRSYKNRFCNSSWPTATIIVYDFDAMTHADFLGKITVDLEPTAQTTVELEMPTVCCYPTKTDAVATLTYSIAWRKYPMGSRLLGSWRVCILNAKGLVRHDTTSNAGGKQKPPDPYCAVLAEATRADASNFRFRQHTRTFPHTSDPEWNETFELPVVADAHYLSEVLTEVGLDPQTVELEKSLPPEVKDKEKEDLTGFQEWRACLDRLVPHTILVRSRSEIVIV